MRVRKIRPGNKIAQMLRNAEGAPVSVNFIRSELERDPAIVNDRVNTLYKLSGYVRDIYTYDGGIVKATKSGREVLAYSLVNFYEFSDKGFRFRGDELSAAQNAHLNAMHKALTGEDLPGMASVTETVAEAVLETVTMGDDTPMETVSSSVEEDPIISPDYVEPVEETASDVTEAPSKPGRARDARGHFLKAA